MGSEHGQPKVTEQDFLASIEQHVLRFDIAVHEPLVMGIAKPKSPLRGVDDDDVKRQAAACWMKLSQQIGPRRPLRVVCKTLSAAWLLR